jgi:hypothetical protein
MHQYEISLAWRGKGRIPKYTRTEYGFGMNPPVVINAKNKQNALKQLKIPKIVKIKKIVRV